MSKPIVRIYTEPNVFIDREMTDDEFAQYEIDQSNALAEKSAAEAKAAQRQAILDRIGLTADELQIILG
jgi:hypothetical protein